MSYSGASLYDPSGPDTFVAAVMWIKTALLGTLATSSAILAVAVLGFLLLTGRLDLRRGVTTVIGCFILFGAPLIASGILDGVVGDERGPERSISLPLAPLIVTTAPSPPQVSSPGYDPYAGASVPQTAGGWTGRPNER